MAYKTDKRPALGCTILAVVLSIMAIPLTPIGHFFVYGWLVPIISPVIPKPDGVPSRADAEYHWKGFGLVWTWENTITGGCARWMAAEGPSGPVRTLDIYSSQNRCGEGVSTMSRMSFVDATTYGSQPNEWPYQECPFTLSEATVRRYQNQVQDLSDLNGGEIEAKMLEAMRAELEQIDGMNMRAQQYGCRAGLA